MLTRLWTRLQIRVRNPLRRKFFNEADDRVRYDARFFEGPLPLADLQDRLRILLDVLGTVSTRFFLDAGTLLGAYREGDIIPWDDDIDVGMLIGDLLELPARARVTQDTLFERSPHARQRYPDPRNMVDARLICTSTGAYVDVFAFRPASENLLTSSERIILGKPGIPRDVLLPFGEITFAGRRHNAPRDVKAYLHLTYGEDLSPDREPFAGPDGKIHYRPARSGGAEHETPGCHWTASEPGQRAPFDLTLQGRYRSGIQVQLYGMLEGCHSIASVCTQLGRVLTERLDGAALHSYNGGSFYDRALSEYAYVDNEAPIGIFYGFPSEITAAFYQHPFRIGGFVCETDRIHPSWVEVCNSLHLVIVPSTFCRAAFYDSGVRVPVMVVPHGLEPEYRPYQEKRRATPLVFYNVFDAGSLLERKSAEELVRCFLEAFGPSGDECVLRLRTGISRRLVDIRQRYEFGKAILLDLPDGRDTAAFARIYSEVHCTVHPSKGEGFGLIPLQSIACETPVIAPAVTGMADYLDQSNAICLRTSGRTAGHVAGNQAGTYFTLDEPHLVELLRHVHANWEVEYRKVRDAGPGLRARYPWDTVLSELVAVIESVLSSSDLDGLARSLRDRFGPS